MNTKEKRISLFDCPIDVLTMDETMERIDLAIQKNNHIHHALVNAATIVNLQKDPVLKDGIVHCDLINADGQGVILAARALGMHLPERVSGPDLMEKIVELAYERKYRIFFLGAEPYVVKKVVETYSARFSPDIIAGYRNGYFTDAEEPQIARQIAASKPNILLVAITSPKKESFLYRNKALFANINLITGVGGCFDIVAGKTRRAPVWMQKSGLEWFYRMMQEPGRLFKRYLTTNAILLKMIFQSKLLNKS